MIELVPKVLGATALAAALLLSAPAANARRATPAPHGNAQGLSLLRRVHAAYQHVPAVQTRARLGPVREQFTLSLRNGIATAEQFLGVGPTGTTILVARGSGPTYAREAGTSCWRRLTRSNSQSLEDVGVRFPDSYRMLVKAPRRAGAAWLLPVVSQGRFPNEKVAVTLRVDASTLLLESEAARVGGHTVTQRVRELTRRPKLATPTPAC